MLDQKTIDNIRETGHMQGAEAVEERNRILRQELGFRVADRAEYALIASCFLPTLITQDMKAFKNLLEYLEIDYTLLPKERCCGNLLYRMALKDKTGEELKQAVVIAQEFLEDNLRQAGEVGASKVVAYCVGCDLAYERLRATIPVEIMWYPSLLARLFRGGKLELKADYYAGCHYFYHRTNNSLPDLDSPLRILKRIEGLELNQLDDRLCCTRPQQMEPLLASIENKTIITVCTGCAMNLQAALKDRGDYRVVMLPEVAWASVSDHSL